MVVWNRDNLRELSAKNGGSHEKGDFSVFEGLKVAGAPEFVISGGRMAVYEYQLNEGMAGQGGFVKLPAKPEAPYETAEAVARADEAKLAAAAIERAQEVSGMQSSMRSYSSSSNQQQQQQNNPEMFGVTTPRRCTDSPVMNKKLGMYQRPVSAHGVRNQQDSTFSLYGGTNDGSKASIKVHAPPGGGSKNLW